MALELITRDAAGTPHKTPLLCVHGIFHGAWCYNEHFLPYLASQGFHAGAVSLRGHGASSLDGALRWTRYHHYVQDIESAVQQMATKYGEPPVIIGHSMGAYLTQKYLEKHSAPGGVLMASVPAHGSGLATLRVFSWNPLRFLAAFFTLDFTPAILHAPEKTRRAFFSTDMPPELLQSYYDRMGPESFLIFLDFLLFALPHPKRVNAPVLVVAGENDTLFKTWEEERLARSYQGEYALIHGTAHDLMLEKTWQQAADKIIAWVKAKGLT